MDDSNQEGEMNDDDDEVWETMYGFHQKRMWWEGDLSCLVSCFKVLLFPVEYF